MTKDEEIMELALSFGRLSEKTGDVPVGAAVTDRDGNVIATGCNTREAEQSFLGHAEINALRLAGNNFGSYNLSECTLYSTLEPCPMCAGACISAGVKRIVFGAYDKKNGAVTSVIDLANTGFTHIPQITGGILEKECAALPKNFFAELRKNTSSLTFSEAAAPIQRKRCAELLGLSEKEFFEETDKNSVFLTVRKNGKQAAAVQLKGKVLVKAAVKKDYAAYVTQDEIFEMLKEAGLCRRRS